MIANLIFIAELTRSMSTQMDKPGLFLFLPMLSSVPAYPGTSGRSTACLTETWSALLPCPTLLSTCTLEARDVSKFGILVNLAVRVQFLSWIAWTETTTSEASNSCLMDAPLWLEEKRAHCLSGTWLLPTLASRLSWPAQLQLAMLSPSAPTPRSASAAAVMATLQSGIFTTRLWSDSSRVTQMEPVVSTSQLMEPSSGLEDWTTRWGLGTWEKEDNCSSTTSAVRYSVSDIVQLGIGSL